MYKSRETWNYVSIKPDKVLLPLCFLMMIYYYVVKATECSMVYCETVSSGNCTMQKKVNRQNGRQGKQSCFWSLCWFSYIIHCSRRERAKDWECYRFSFWFDTVPLKFHVHTKEHVNVTAKSWHLKKWHLSNVTFVTVFYFLLPYRIIANNTENNSSELRYLSRVLLNHFPIWYCFIY